MKILLVLLLVPFLMIPAFAESQTLPTEKDTLDVKLTYDIIEPNIQTKISIDGTIKHLGSFKTTTRAALAFDRAVIQSKLPSSYLNFVHNKYTHEDDEEDVDEEELTRNPNQQLSSGNSTGFKGVCRKRNKYNAQITIGREMDLEILQCCAVAFPPATKLIISRALLSIFRTLFIVYFHAQVLVTAEIHMPRMQVSPHFKYEHHQLIYLQAAASAADLFDSMIR